MRLFTAIDIPDEVRDRLRELVARWKPLARIHWSSAANLHITTKFIGEWPEGRLEEIKNALHAMAPLGAFDISVRGLGWFPNPQRPRVLWAGVEAGDALGRLAHATETAVAALGVPVEERADSPHLTLARIRETIPLDTLRTAVSHARGAADFGTFSRKRVFAVSFRGRQIHANGCIFSVNYARNPRYCDRLSVGGHSFRVFAGEVHERRRCPCVGQRQHWSDQRSADRGPEGSRRNAAARHRQRLPGRVDRREAD